MGQPVAFFEILRPGGPAGLTGVLGWNVPVQTWPAGLGTSAHARPRWVRDEGGCSCGTSLCWGPV